MRRVAKEVWRRLVLANLLDVLDVCSLASLRDSFPGADMVYCCAIQTMHPRSLLQARSAIDTAHGKVNRTVRRHAEPRSRSPTKDPIQL